MIFSCSLNHHKILQKYSKYLKNYKSISNLAISIDQTKVGAVGRHITEEEYRKFKELNIKDSAIKTELKFLGHKFNLNYVSNDKINTDAIVANLRKNMLVGIAKCLRNLKLTLIGRGTAARALAACHIDKTALYKLNHDQIKICSLPMTNM